jgi:hypothetical protein
MQIAEFCGMHETMDDFKVRWLAPFSLVLPIKSVFEDLFAPVMRSFSECSFSDFPSLHLFYYRYFHLYLQGRAKTEKANAIR